MKDVTAQSLPVLINGTENTEPTVRPAKAKQFRRHRKVRVRPSTSLTRYQFEKLFGGDFKPMPDGSRYDGRVTTFLGKGGTKAARANGRTIEGKTWHEVAKKLGLV